MTTDMACGMTTTEINNVIEEGICPDCGNKLIPQGGCMTCINPECGFSKCG